MKLILATSMIAGSLLWAASAGAQTTASPGGSAPGTGAVTTTSKASANKQAQTPKSKACSMEADKQGLHGKARKAFRNKCKHT